jgi:hypothetical protein
MKGHCVATIPGYFKAVKRHISVELVPKATKAGGLCNISTPSPGKATEANGLCNLATMSPGSYFDGHIEANGLCNLATMSPGSYFDGRMEIRVGGCYGLPNLMRVADGVYGNITVRTLKRDTQGGGEVLSQSQRNARKEALARDALMVADPVAFFTNI